jgi:zinc protease
MQAVIVVGDFDVDMMEQKIKETFSSIPAPEVPTVKPIIPIPGNEEPAVAIITDPEATSSSIQLIWKGDAMPKEYASTDVAFMTDIIKMIIGDAFAERMEAITASSTAPFMSGSLGISQLVEGTDAVMSEVSFKDGDYKKALEAFYTEIERIKRYGITESELERAKMELISSAERGVEAAPTRKSPQLVYPILNHFFHNNYMLEPEVELQLTQAICAQLPAMVFQQIIDQMITEENMLIAYTAPEREGLVHPTEAELLAVIESVKASEIAAPVEEGANEPLLDADAIKAGKIKKEKAAAYGATEWTLSNGVKVVYLPTAHKADEVQVRVVMNGGRSLIETAELPSFDDNVWALYSQNRGLSKFSGVQLKKLLTGKNVRCELNIEKTRHNINIVSTPKDLETAMQLLYLNVTAPRFDNEEFLIGINQIKAVLPNLEKMPQLKLQKLIMETLYGNHERVITINSEVVEKANINDFEKASRRLFSNVAGATVYVVGNVDAETLKPLVAKYIASLPGGKKGSKFIDRSEDIVKGNVVKNEAMVMETPKSTVLQVYTAYMPYSIKNEVLLDIAKLYLDMVYVETLRESEGGTYGASVATICSREPKDVAIMQVAFETNPESAEKLSNLAVEGVQKLVAEGIPADKFDMIIKNIKKNIPQDRISNRYWGSVLQKSVEFGDKYDSEYEEAVDTATPEAVVKAVKELLADDNFIQLVVSPEK